MADDSNDYRPSVTERWQDWRFEVRARLARHGLSARFLVMTVISVAAIWLTVDVLGQSAWGPEMWAAFIGGGYVTLLVICTTHMLWVQTMSIWRAHRKQVTA